MPTPDEIKMSSHLVQFVKAMVVRVKYEMSKRNFLNRPYSVNAVIGFGLTIYGSFLLILFYYISIPRSRYVPFINENNQELQGKELNILDSIEYTFLGNDTIVEKWGDGYIVHSEYRSDKNFQEDSIVTICSHTTVDMLPYILDLVKRWQGPISLAVYAPGPDYLAANKVIQRLRYCHIAIKRLVTFHLFHEVEDVSTDDSGRQHSPGYEPQCFNLRKALFSEVSGYVNRSSRPYPINVARNIASYYATSLYVLMLDVDLLPSANLMRDFLSIIRSNPYRTPKTVYVLHSFVVQKDLPLPGTMQELLSLLHVGNATLFAERRNATVPGYTAWRDAQRAIDVGTKVLHRHRYVRGKWEPVFISTKDVPWFNETFTLADSFNKQLMVYEMCLQSFRFAILHNAFVVHRDGPHVQNVQDMSKESQKRFTASMKATDKLYKFGGPPRRMCKFTWGKTTDKNMMRAH